MRLVVQRVQHASCTVDGKVTGKIGKGFLVLVGIEDSDTEQLADRMAAKLVGLRIFEDENGKTNLNLQSVGGSLLLISQFTLYADCHHGNRPSFIRAGEPKKPQALYQYLIKTCRESVPDVQEGIFGADMKIELLNDGPFTILLDSDEMFGKS